MSETTRRQFVQQLAAATGGVVLLPVVSACGGAQNTGDPSLPPVPTTPPDDWDPIEFNRMRGNAGAIPDSYLDDINGPEGEHSHLGKHLPYIADIDASMVPAGYIAIMWGDPDLGHSRHPNAVRSEANNMEGHWYNWIRIRKATPEGDTEPLESSYSDWPDIGESDSGAYAVYGGGDILEDDGKNTIYLAALPEGVGPGDTIRIWAHCLTHGQYIDFITL